MERKVCVKTDADPSAEPAGGWHRKEEAMEAYEVFTQKYTEVYRDLYRFACYMLRNPQDAEDVVGETVADAYAGFSNLRSIDAFRSWIFQILSNKCRRRLKEYAQKTVELPEELRAPQAETEEQMDVRKAFFRLDEQERLLIGLRVFGGYNSREIGQMLQMNENTVRSRIHRGLGKMRGWLDE